MDVLSLLRLIVRHWRVTVPAALLTVVGLTAALRFSSPTYEATGSIVLLSPPEAPGVDEPSESATPPGAGQNPFARYGDLSVVADILARVMDSDSTRGELESQDVTEYEVVANRFQRGPVVDVTGQGPSSDAAIRSTEVVLTEAEAVLSKLQRAEDADPEYFINSAPLDPPSTATAMYGSTVRAAIAALAFGALCTLGLAVLAEALARRRTVRTGMSDTATLGSEGGTSNGSRKAGLSRILPALRLARWEEPSKPEPAWQKMPQQGQTKQEPSKPESAWQKTFQQERSSELPTDNGHTQPTTRRSP